MSLEDAVQNGMQQELDEKKMQKEAALSLKIDDSNRASIYGYPYEFEATSDRVLIAVDIFKSDYDCKTCSGIGEVEGRCACENTSRPGYAYLAGLETEPLYNIKCKQCKGDFESYRTKEKCPDCNGKGALIFLGKADKILPTTGIIVSKGEAVKESRYSLGARVVFGKFSGTAIPTKAVGVMFKFLREHEILGIIYHGETLGTFNFIVPEIEAN